MFNPPSSVSTNEGMSGSIYNILSNDNIKPNGIDQRYPEQNQLFSAAVVSNICEDESDEENDDNEDMVPMDITDAIEPVRVSVNHTIQHNLHTVASNLSSEPSNFPILGHPTMSSNISYQPKCASSTVSSAQRYRQWQILGGGFGENYDILPPEEEDELDEESEKEAEEAKNFEIDLSSFLEQIISVHVRKHLKKDGNKVATLNFFKCNCFRSDCRIKQYLEKNEMINTDTIQEANQTPPSSNVSTRSSECSQNSISSNTLSEKISSNNSTEKAASSKMLNLVLKQKNNLNIESEVPDSPRRSEHHTTYIGRSSQVISSPQRQKQYTNHNNMTTSHNDEYVSSCPMPDLPKECSIELRKAHDDMLRRAGGMNRVKRLYDELAFLAKCLGSWRFLLETSPKEGNTLLMWLCCQPHKTQQHTNAGGKIRGIMLDINRFLYSKILAVVMAMICEAYGNDTKDIKNKCLIFGRNSEEASSLELAALTNKSVVACWLALLYPCFGLDVNEPNQQGHTVLHFLARKGDEAAETLQELLRLKKPTNCSSLVVPFGRLFRLDVVNSGAKTPLDVAVACEVNSRKDGTSDTQYRKVISCFHDTIVEEAEDFEKNLNVKL